MISRYTSLITKRAFTGKKTYRPPIGGVASSRTKEAFWRARRNADYYDYKPTYSEKRKISCRKKAFINRRALLTDF